MSAGNQTLFSGALSPTTFPSTTSLLGTGNYWIEEIDFIFGYVNTSGATAGVIQVLLEYGVSAFWVTIWLANSTAAASIPFNISTISRPRIFIPRGNSISVNTQVSGLVSQVIFSINLYGRLLP